jgi:DNA polymerase
MSALRQRCLAAIGIPVWVRRQAIAAGDRSDAETSAGGAVAAGGRSHQQGGRSHQQGGRSDQQGGRSDQQGGRSDQQGVGALDWDGLAAAVRTCTVCGLHRTRTQTVFGVGRRDAGLLIIGEAPGAEEDRQGEPFVGPAGQLLNAMLRAIGLPREQVYIANILKCRPPGNRDPKPEESATCTPYLDRQIALIRPRAILVLGRIAGQWLLQSESPIGRLRGQVLRYGDPGIPLVVTYHPAYLLRSPLAKAKTWQDLCLIRDMMAK